jgi:hypothetical protein
MKRFGCLFRKRHLILNSLMLLYSFVIFLSLLALADIGQETLPPLKDGLSPQTLDEVWAGYDPTVEPLEVEVYKAWEEKGIVLRAVRYCIGTYSINLKTLPMILPSLLE